jgi:hypothetical protein
MSEKHKGGLAIRIGDRLVIDYGSRKVFGDIIAYHPASYSHDALFEVRLVEGRGLRGELLIDVGEAVPAPRTPDGGYVPLPPIEEPKV